jgi:hypothetical protein
VSKISDAQPSSLVPGSAHQIPARHAGKPGSLVDFFLHKFNPDGIDYGEKIEEMRADLIADTIQNPFFWCISWGVVMLVGAIVMVFHQERESKHRHLIAARFLAWYHNQLLDAREHALEEVGRFERLRKAVDERDMAFASGGTQGHDELMTENNSLRQKISLAENMAKVLRQENTELKRLLREFRQKNADANTGPSAGGEDDRNGK